MSDKVLKWNVEEFDAGIKSGITLVDFWAEWCGPCKMMLPFIDAVAEEMGEKIKVAKVNVDECEPLAMRYGIMSIPTVIIFKDGEIMEKMVGLRQTAALIGAVNKYL